MNRHSFSHRGFMLDVCRHFMSCENIMKLLDAAELLGLNRMHWHLTDDQGWRIEIPRYPKLTQTGSRRGDSFFGGTSVSENNDGFYTREDIRRIVAYARRRGIEIIPEIELPGHASALLAAYPDLACRRTSGPAWQEHVKISGGIFPNLICAGRDEVIRFMEDILDDVMELFPFPIIHIGGDEALKIRWRRCPDCRRKMRRLGLDSEDALQRSLVLEIGQYLADRGRKTMVWSDVLSGGNLPSHFIVQQWWNDGENVRRFMQSGGTVVCSDNRICYLDYPYGSIDVKTILEYPDIPDYARGCEDRLLGFECPLWTERISNLQQAAYQLFPRLTVLALKMSGRAVKEQDGCLAQVRELEGKLDAMGLRGAPETVWMLSPKEAEESRQQEHDRVFSEEAMPYVRLEQQLTLLDRTERFMKQIGIPEDLLLRSGDILLAELYGEDLPADADGEAELIRQMMIAVNSRSYGAWKDLPEEIWLNTMKCFPRFIGEYRQSYGRNGFDRGFWTTRQIGARLFRIGELEYEMVEEQPGKKEISLHIPSDVLLEPEKLNDSVAHARRFFLQYFPDYADAPIVCESWLLSPALEEMLPASSRILRFRKAFEITETDPEDDAALEWVFHVAEGQRKTMKVKNFPEDTVLQREMKKRLLTGRNAGSASGILVRPF